MNSMFSGVNLTSIDLSSFDTSSVTSTSDINSMFENSSIKTIIGRTQEDCNKYISSSYSPSGLTCNVNDN